MSADRLPIRKPGPHNGRGPVSGFALKKLSSILFFFQASATLSRKKNPARVSTISSVYIDVRSILVLIVLCMILLGRFPSQ